MTQSGPFKLRIAEKIRLSILFVFVFGVFLNLSAEVYTIENIPTLKNKGTVCLIDLVEQLSGWEKAEINRFSTLIEDSSTVHVAVVILPSVGNEDPREIARKMFEKWGVGKTRENNGLLVLMVMDQAQIAFERSRMISGILSKKVFCDIQDQKIQPFLEEGKLERGLIAALDGVQAFLLKKKYVDFIKRKQKPRPPLPEPMPAFPHHKKMEKFLKYAVIAFGGFIWLIVAVRIMRK